MSRYSRTSALVLQESSAGRHEAFRRLPAAIQVLDLVRRRGTREVPDPATTDVSDSVGRPRREINRRVGSEHFPLAARAHLATPLDDIVHRLDRPVFVDGRASSRADVDDREEELPRPGVVRRDELIRESLVALPRLRGFAADDLHASTAGRKQRRAFGAYASAPRTRV